MAIAVTARADNAIVIYDEDDPRYGVVIASPSEVATLINTLTKTATGLHGENAWKMARMRALMQDDADEDWGRN